MTTENPLRRWADGWWVAAHLSVHLLLAGLYWTALVVLVTGVALTPVFGAGIPLVLLGRVMLEAGARVERRRLGLLGLDLPDPAPWSPDGPWWRRWLLDPRTWRYAGHLGVVGTVGVVGGTVLLGLASVGLAALAAPFVADRWTDTTDAALSWPFGIPGSIPVADGIVVAVGFVLVLLVPPLARAFAAAELATGPLLLGPVPAQREQVLAARVATLTSSRDRTVGSVEEERQRIERDLHDGPQQRLVALAMQLGMARRALDRGGPEAAREFLDAASVSASSAIADMRMVARGIHPPVLTDRGLDAAVSALAASAPVPVAVQVLFDASDRQTRPSQTAEAIAYFCVSEALTNVAKHARATQATVQAWRDMGPAGRGEQRPVADVLRLRISDDGVGGAGLRDGTVADGGSGLRGLADRLGGVDGWLRVDSPEGGPTAVEIGIPWAAGGAR